MVNRRQPPEPQRPHLSVVEKKQAITRLERRIEELNAFDAENTVERNSPAQRTLETAIAETLATIFGHATVEYRRYHSACSLHNGAYVMNTGFGNRRDEAAENRKYLMAGKANAVAMLRGAIKFLEEEIEFAEPPAVEIEVPAKLAAKPSNEVFIVHGHNEGAREAVARFLQKGGLKPIILHEIANQGRMVLQKFLDSSDVGFAVILMTPDDFGAANGSEPKPRARQNVILELGYFIGKLGQSRVCALKSGDIELPTDILGIGWTSLDNNAWHVPLWRELKAAGYDVKLEEMVS